MRKIGELKGKPIIEGNPNEIKKNQIHYKESDGGITLSERKEDNTLSSVTSSSGSGEGDGVKEYYYKILNDQVVEMIKGLAYGETIIKISTGENINGSLTTLYEGSTYESLLAVKIYDIKLYCFNSSDGSFNKNFGPFEGDIWNRMATYSTLAGGGTVTPEQIKEQLSSMIQEITKEEYEAMITYKPE